MMLKYSKHIRKETQRGNTCRMQDALWSPPGVGGVLLALRLISDFKCLHLSSCGAYAGQMSILCNLGAPAAIFNSVFCGLGRLSHVPESPQLVQSDETSVLTGGFLSRISLEEKGIQTALRSGQVFQLLSLENTVRPWRWLTGEEHDFAEN